MNARKGNLASHDLYVIVEALINAVSHGANADPRAITEEINSAISQTADVFGMGQVGVQLDVVKSLLALHRYSASLERLRRVIVIQGR